LLPLNSRNVTLRARGRIAALRHDGAGVEEALTEAIEIVDTAAAGSFGAIARVALADARHECGDRASAEALLRQVVEWSRGPVAGAGRVTFYGGIAS